MAIGKFHLCHLLDVCHVTIEHDGSNLLDMVGLCVVEILKNELILPPRLSIELIIRTTVFIYYFIDILVRCIKIALIIGNHLLLHSIYYQRNLYLDDPGDIHID